MKRFLGVLVVSALLSGQGSEGRADEKDATPILDKAIAALGGEAKLAKAGAATWKTKGTITFNDNTSPVKGSSAVEGIDKHRAEFEMEFDGNPFKGVTVLNGSKGWRKFGDDLQDLDDELLASEKNRAYLMVVPMTILPLKGKGFKVEAAPEEKVGDKPAAVVKGTGPDGKTFTLYFDKETGLPLKLSAVVRGFQGEQVNQETTFSDYKDFDGLKRATKTESKRDGNPFIKLDVIDFKVVDKHEPNTFTEPN
jgi:hypothetical protein